MGKHHETAFEYKALKVEFKAVDDTGQFEGYASTRTKDQGGDVVAEGAFKRTIDQNGGVFPILWFHDPATPVGLGEVREDGHGLYTKGRLNLDKQIAKDLLSDMKFGVVDRLSIGFRTIQSEYDSEKDVRMITEARLLEYSLITKNFAMNEQALITNVKSLEHPTVKQFIDAWEVVEELRRDVKEGRVLSAKNRAHVESAIGSMTTATQALSELLAAASPEPDTGKSHSGDGELTTEQPSSSEYLHLLRQNVEAMKSSFTGQL